MHPIHSGVIQSGQPEMLIFNDPLEDWCDPESWMEMNIAPMNRKDKWDDLCNYSPVGPTLTPGTIMGNLLQDLFSKELMEITQRMPIKRDMWKINLVEIYRYLVLMRLEIWLIQVMLSLWYIQAGSCVISWIRDWDGRRSAGHTRQCTAGKVAHPKRHFWAWESSQCVLHCCCSAFLSMTCKKASHWPWSRLQLAQRLGEWHRGKRKGHQYGVHLTKGIRLALEREGSRDGRWGW